MRTKHGIHVHGFPNLFIVQPTQGANLISNVPHNLTEAAKTIAADRRARARRGGDAEVEVTEEAEDAWIELLLTGPGTMLANPDCTPGYYNNEGQPTRPRRRALRRLPRRRHGLLPVHRRSGATAGDFEGLEFR